MTEYTQCWEQWVGSTARPVERIKPRARVTKRDGRNWITFPDEINGRNVIVEMPDNAPTKSLRPRTPRPLRASPRRPGRRRRPCSSSACPGSSGAADAACHRDPHRAGRLF